MAQSAKSTYWQIFKECFGRPHILWINGLYAVINGLIFIRDNMFPESWRRTATLPGVFRAFHLPGWIIFILLTNIILLAEGTVRAVRKREEEINSLKETLEAAERGRPNIQLKQPNPVVFKLVRQQVLNANQIIRDAPFLCLRFVNDPQNPNPSAIARAISAKVRYFIAGESDPVLEIDGRWADTDEASFGDPRQSRHHLLTVDFNIGDEHEVDIAFIASETGRMFAWNNDNYRYSDLIKPEHILPDSAIDVQVRLRGLGVDNTFRLRFANLNSTFEIINQPQAL